MQTSKTYPRGNYKTKTSYPNTYIQNLIRQHNKTKTANILDNQLEEENQQINIEMQKYRVYIWTTHLEGHWDHIQNIRILWKTMNKHTNKKSPPNTKATIKQLSPPKQRAYQFI